MPPDVRVFLESSNLYQDLYLARFERSDHKLPTFFSYGPNLQVRLVNHFSEEAITAAHVHPGSGSITAYMADEYGPLKDFADFGVKTIWFNREGVLVEDEFPLQDADIVGYDALKNIPVLLDKPTLGQCLDWLDEWQVPDNIRRHSAVVARSAYLLAVKMRRRGVTIDPILAHRAGLLHDIDKIDTLNHSATHGAMGADFLDAQGYPEIARIVREHIMSTILQPEAGARSWENKLVFFCDKLVEGDELVPFDERLAALKRRYPYYVKTMEKAAPYIWTLSDEICDVMGIASHGGLVEMMHQAIME